MQEQVSLGVKTPLYFDSQDFRSVVVGKRMIGMTCHFQTYPIRKLQDFQNEVVEKT